MSRKVYTIKPLEWTYYEATKTYEARTSLAIYRVTDLGGYWAYGEVTDGLTNEARKLEDAKAECEKLWLNDLLECLEEVGSLEKKTYRRVDLSVEESERLRYIDPAPIRFAEKDPYPFEFIPKKEEDLNNA